MQQIVELKNAAQCASLILFVGEVVLVYWPSLVIVSFNHGLITYFFLLKINLPTAHQPIRCNI